MRFLIEDKLKERLKELKKLAGNEYQKIQEIIKEFEKAKGKTALEKISKQAFPFEKKYIPELKENQQIVQSFKPDTLIMTVGHRKEPVILSILCLKPKNLILLPSKQTREIADKVFNDKDIKTLNLQTDIFEIDEIDASKNYQIIKENVLPLTKGSILIDPTAGRKIMVSSLSLIAFYYKLPIVYLYTYEKNGFAFPFTETLKKIENPFEFFGDKGLEIIQDQFNSHFYEAAIITCKTTLETIRDPKTYKKIELIKELIEIYRDWDSFQHSAVPQKKPTLSERLEETKRKIKQLGFDTALPKNIDENIEFLKGLEARWKNKLNIIDEYRIVDLYVNALRRGSVKQAKYDDAIARLYRIIEMCASYKLLEYGIGDLSNPNYYELCKNTQNLEQEFKKIKGQPLPKENLALENQMIILGIIDKDDKIHRIYESMKKSKSDYRCLMDKRNRSILAHGTDPLNEEDWVKFRDQTQTIIEFTIGREKFENLLKKAFHGQIKL